MFNKVFLIGNLARDPELRYTPSGIPVARFAIAVNRRQKKSAEGNNNNDVDFINIVAWRRLAEICGEFLKKGRPVAIEGKLQLRPYEKGGEKRIFAEVIADNMQMLGRKPQTEQTSAPPPVAGSPQGEEAAPSAGEEEIPF